MSEESVMKQAVSPEVPARVRRVPFRTLALSVGASALAMACSFGEIDGETPIDDINLPPPGGETPLENPTDSTGEPTVTDPGGPDDGPSVGGSDDPNNTIDPDSNPFATEMG